MDSGLATGSSLPHPVRHLPLFLHPDRIQRLHLRQPPHVPGHPLTALSSSISAVFCHSWRNLRLGSDFLALWNKVLIHLSWLGWKVKVSTVNLRYDKRGWGNSLERNFQQQRIWRLERTQLCLAPAVLLVQKLLLPPDWQEERTPSGFSWIVLCPIWR